MDATIRNDSHAGGAPANPGMSEVDPFPTAPLTGKIKADLDPGAADPFPTAPRTLVVGKIKMDLDPGEVDPFPTAPRTLVVGKIKMDLDPGEVDVPTAPLKVDVHA
jgi:hypothetical protein